MSESTNGAPLPPDNPRGDGRLGDGRFAPGNKFSHGNPINRKMFVLRAALLNAVDRPTIEAAARKMGELAAAGDVAACKVLFEYTLGRPVQAIELNGSLGMMPEGPGLVALVLASLAPYPEARAAVAASLARAVDGEHA